MKSFMGRGFNFPISRIDSNGSMAMSEDEENIQQAIHSADIRDSEG
jgi:hypothetical protein